MRRACTLIAALILASCDSRPESPTATENRALNEVEEMLDNASDSIDAIDDSELVTNRVKEER